jgi:hypothetical protein
MILSAIFSHVLSEEHIFYTATFLKLPQNEDYVSHPYKGTPTPVVLCTLTL